MATATPQCKKSKAEESQSRGWTAKPILGPEYTEDPPLEDVYVGLVKERKDISTIIQTISTSLPGFSHLKRCSSNRLLLATLRRRETSADTNLPPEEDVTLTQEKLKSRLKESGFELSLLEDDFQVVKVPARVPRTKAQASRASKVWPVNFHPDPNIERLIDGSVLSERQLDGIESYMRVVMEAARLESVGSVACDGSAMIVDPADGKVLAIAASKIDSHPMWHASMLAVDLVARVQGGGAWQLYESRPSASTSVPTAHDELLGTAQEGTEIRANETSCSTVESDVDVGERAEGDLKRRHSEEPPLCYPRSLSKIPLPIQESLKPENVQHGRRSNGTARNSGSKDSQVAIEGANGEKSGPYLCTGYWVFLLREPCPLCAMALLHSRVQRIFYGAANEKTGVLGSKGILHAVPGLNHRYQVWSGVLERECQEVIQEIERRNAS